MNTVQIEALRIQRACSFHRQTEPLLQNCRSQPRNPKASLRRGFSDSHPGLIWHTSSLKSTVFMCAGFHFKSAGHVPGAYGTMTCPHSCRETVSTLKYSRRRRFQTQISLHQNMQNMDMPVAILSLCLVQGL